MTFEILGTTQDQRTKSHIIYCKCSINHYLKLVGDDFKDFFIQRKRESHKAYSRLKKDIIDGALLPSITLSIKQGHVSKVIDGIGDIDRLTEVFSVDSSVNILDGLQRTYILSDLSDDGHEFPDEQEILLECWAEPSVDHLIYRMIVLNSGQKSMSMRHQIELLFVSLRETLSNRVENIEIVLERDAKKRTRSSKYSLGDVASAYHAFINKQTELDKASIVSEKLLESSGLDLDETEIIKGFNLFVEYFKTYTEIDRLAWGHYKKLADDGEVRYKELRKVGELCEDEIIEYAKLRSFRNGHKWLGSENTMISFFCAVSSYLGTKKEARVNDALRKLKYDIEQGIEDPLGLIVYDFYKAEINPRKVNVGFGTRQLLLKGFKEFFTEEGDTVMGECWKLAAD